uniref:restriction endonuclease subunit S n=1 Tax=Helicobacter pylori TaxID=210 RepID=UPI0036F43369
MLLDFKDINQNHKDAKIKTYPKRLKTLLQTLAPKGVEFKTLEEVFEIKNGYTPSKNNPEFWEKGTIPWFRMEDIRENGRILKDSIQHITPKALKGKKLFPKNSIIISTTATIGEHALLIVDSLANQQFTFLSKKANCGIALDMKFFFYQCFLLGEWCKKNTNVSGFASVDMTAFKKYKFPIPPLEIQQEIVKILDAFTELNTELNTRKKQYQYYQNMLLDFKDINQNHKDAKIKTYPKRLKTLLQTLAPKGVEFKTLEEVFEIKNGYTPSKNNPEFWEKGTIPWFRMEDIRENGRILKDSIQHITPKALKGKKLFPKNSIIISTTATIGEHALLIVDSLANQQFTFLSKKANCGIALDMKFFFYQCFLLGEWCKKNTNVSGFASVDMTAFKKYKFPIPPLEIQQEIVKIL